MICPCCGSEDVIHYKSKIKCKSCGAEEPVLDKLGRIIHDEARGILLDAKAVARYHKQKPPGVV